ncbi:MAG: hypothetical protein ACOC9W_06340 [Persicimonas sp.]
MEVDPQSAMRGVRSRLIGAVMAASVTLVCVLYAMLSSMGSFGATFALTVGLCSFGAAVALLLSARHEEEVHELAFQFEQLPVDPMASAALADVAEESTDDSASAARPRALPAPDPLEGLGRERFDRSEHPAVRLTKRADFSGHTDGAL